MNSTFIWYELITDDQQQAADFYGKVVGWTAEPFPGSDAAGEPYLILSKDGRGSAGILRRNADMAAAGMPPIWLGYIAVADADAAVAAIRAAGGRVHMGPQEVPGVGRIAMATDPGDALFYILEPKPAGEPPAPVERMTPGGCGWRELYSSAGEKAAFGFYAGLFGWETIREMDMGPMGTYRVWGVDGQDLGGMMDKPEQLPRSGWGYYFVVEGVDSAAERVRANGGSVHMGPMEVPDGSWVVQCSDPQGAAFCLVSKTR